LATQLERQNGEAEVVGKIKTANKKTLTVGKPRKIVASSMRSKVAYCGAGGVSGGGGGFSSPGANLGFGGNYYSPELSTDFLELPQSLDEQRNYYRFFYRSDPFVGQAIDIHTELPLSKIRLSMPKASNRALAEASLRFCEKWVDRIGLLHRLIEIVHEYFLIGEVYVFAEDTNDLMPREIIEDKIDAIDEETGEITTTWEEKEDANELAYKWLRKRYKGWTALRVLPPEQIHMESFPFTDEKLIELVPDSKSKKIVEKADAGDPTAMRIVSTMPEGIVNHIRDGINIPLNTDPLQGSFLFHLSRKKSQYEPRGHSILERCILPGTPVWVNRNGIIQQILIEDVDVNSDLLLTHKGNFRRAEKGNRPVDEEIVQIYTEGSKEPLQLTTDHRVLVVDPDLGTEKWVYAGDLQAGDLLCEPNINPKQKPPTEIDLTQWWDHRSWEVGRRFRENQRGIEKHTRQVEVQSVEAGDGFYLVTFKHQQDDAGRIDALSKTEKLLGWLKGLRQPTPATYQSVSDLLGLKKSEIANAVVRLREHPEFQVERGQDRVTIWYPLPKKAEAPGKFEFQTKESTVKKIQLDDNFCYLLGTWLGDGNVWTTDEVLLNASSLGWTFGLDSTKLRDTIIGLIPECFGDVDILGHPYKLNQSTYHIRVDDQLLARWFMDNFGHGSAGKHLPDWFFELPKSCLMALLRGLLDTDGSLHVSKKRTQIDFQLKSRVLIDQIHLLCNRVGIHTNVSTIQRSPSSCKVSWATQGGETKKKYEYGERIYYRLTCTRWPDIQRWAKGTIKGAQTPVPNRKITRPSRFIEGRLTRSVLDVLRIPYLGTVLSFDVEGDESLTARNLCVHNCIRTLVYRDKLRQAQTSIASRHMTPFRIVYGEDLNEEDVANLREQVDLALQDPDYSIIANFEVRWEEMGAERRLLELSSEYDLTDRQLYAGLGVTESLLSGESSYSGDRINLEVINTRYMLLREIIQDVFEKQILKPMCEIMGFVEEDIDGEEVVIYPRISFTRLALRDNHDTFDALFNLYQKGSLDVDAILEILNIDPIATKEKLERDKFTMQDSSFNEIFRSIYSRAGDSLAENSDVVELIANNLGLKFEKPQEGGGRF